MTYLFPYIFVRFDNKPTYVSLMACRYKFDDLCKFDGFVSKMAYATLSMLVVGRYRLIEPKTGAST